MLHTFWTSAESTRFPPTGLRMFRTEADFWNARLKRSEVKTQTHWGKKRTLNKVLIFRRCEYLKSFPYFLVYLSLLTGRLFCDVLGSGGEGVGSWLSSFLERTSLKSVRMTETPHRYWSCLVTSGIDSFRLQWTGNGGSRGYKDQLFESAISYTSNYFLRADNTEIFWVYIGDYIWSLEENK